MQRPALKPVCTPTHRMPVTAPTAPKPPRSTGVQETASLPHAAFVRDARAHFECPRCGDRAPFCVWCRATSHDVVSKLDDSKSRPRRASWPALIGDAPLMVTPSTRRPMSAPFSVVPPTSLPSSTDSSRPVSLFYSPPAHTTTGVRPMSIHQHPTTRETTPSLTPLTHFSFGSSPPTFFPDIVSYSDDDFSRDPGTAKRLHSDSEDEPSPPPLLTPSRYSAYVSRQSAKREARMHRIAECATAAAVTLDAPEPGSPTAMSMRSVQSIPPAPGSIALGHLLRIPGALRVSTTSAPSGSVRSSRTSLDLRSVRSRDEVESMYSPTRSRNNSGRTSILSTGAASAHLMGHKSRTSVHRRGDSSQFSLAALPPAQEDEEDADEVPGPGPQPSTRGKGASMAVGQFMRKVGKAIHLGSGTPKEQQLPGEAQEQRADGPARSFWKSLTHRRRK